MFLKQEHGGSAVEFALVLPVLVVLIFGIVELGLALYDKAVITNASREGARTGILFKKPPVTDDEIRSVVNNYCQNKLVTFGLDKSVTTDIDYDDRNSDGIRNTDDALTVAVAFKYDYLVLPGFISALTGGINMNATTVMRME